MLAPAYRRQALNIMSQELTEIAGIVGKITPLLDDSAGIVADFWSPAGGSLAGVVNGLGGWRDARAAWT